MYLLPLGSKAIRSASDRGSHIKPVTLRKKKVPAITVASKIKIYITNNVQAMPWTAVHLQTSFTGTTENRQLCKGIVIITSQKKDMEMSMPIGPSHLGKNKLLGCMPRNRAFVLLFASSIAIFVKGIILVTAATTHCTYTNMQAASICGRNPKTK